MFHKKSGNLSLIPRTLKKGKKRNNASHTQHRPPTSNNNNNNILIVIFIYFEATSCFGWHIVFTYMCGIYVYVCINMNKYVH